MVKCNTYHTVFYKTIQIVLGLLFVVSGFVKGVDPVGFSYKIIEYLESFGLGAIRELGLGMAVMLCVAEIFIGLMLLTGVYKKIISLLALLFLSVFTIITFYLFVAPAVAIQECGCFGDAFYLSNKDTFIKNIIFTSLSILYFRRQVIVNNISSLSGKRGISIWLTLYMLIISMFIPFYSIVYLPPFDFLPFNKGDNIMENMKKVTEDSGGIKLIYKNKKTGELQKFSMSDFGWQDTSLWEYIDTETTKTGKIRQNNLSVFSIFDKYGEDVTSAVFNNHNYMFIVVAKDADDLQKRDFDKMQCLYQLYSQRVIDMCVISASDSEKKIIENGWSDINIYNIDPVVLKSMLRDDKGVIMMNNGVIVGKWNFNGNSFNNLQRYDLPDLERKERNSITKYIMFISLLIILLGYLNYIKLEKTFKS